MAQYMLYFRHGDTNMRTMHRTFKEAKRAAKTEHQGRYKIVKCTSRKGWMVLSEYDLRGRAVQIDGYPSISCKHVVHWLKNDDQMLNGLYYCMNEENSIGRAAKRFLHGLYRNYSPNGYPISLRAIMIAMSEIRNGENTEM